ncbi:LPXTG cell wall anchor domain-containing protein [Microbacterium flavum]|uniref:LPXTG cell wall anchor domain-containing protein n=1 Tax=Microbacterium flavum TaxID=415216 RepID=A0ABS5XT81_9MICO|nr:LPXTG cell wall anchor domain-containing protein [Microbacterium flavum]MBT8797166.1 LPXTG cell wall anchor domain-containing protein [Microbacterium flavum]
MRKTFVVVGVLALLMAGALPAAAADTVPSPNATDGYGPVTPTGPTLAGSTASPSCSADAPWIDYSVTLTDPDGQATGHTARLVLSDGSSSWTTDLGTVTAGVPLTGSVLWPGASIGADGRGNGWPGWEMSGGQWVQTDGNYGWTRGDITATIEVNPTYAVALSYPPSTPECLTAPEGFAAVAALSDTSALPETGGSTQAVLPLAAGGALVVAIGSVLLLRRRRHERG